MDLIMHTILGLHMNHWMQIIHVDMEYSLEGLTVGIQTECMELSQLNSLTVG